MPLPKFLQDLNVPQRQAVTTTEGKVRVTAGAGTGKTKALTYRYAYLVNVLGIDPANILCLTFTNKAAAQMRKRISLMVQSGDYNDFVCTLHGFCVKFLRQEIYRLGFPKSFSILDEDDAKSVAKQCMDEMGIPRTEKTVRQFLHDVAAEKALTGYIDAYMLPGSHLPTDAAGSPLVAFARQQLKTWSLDFDDLMNFTVYILDHFKDAREEWQKKLNYIMVDEAQDCNTDDWNLLEKLSAGHGNLFIVGDPDQCIYEWRGAKPSMFVQFPAQSDIVLDENYRSTPGILDIANSVISHNVNRIPKTLFTRRAEGRAVIHYHGKSEKEENEWILGQIKTLMEAGAKPSDFAVLYRSTYQSRGIEEVLLNAGIPYSIWGGTRFFERKEIKDTIAYMKLLVNPDDDISFLRIINTPSRKLGRVFLNSLKDRAQEDGTSLYRALERHAGDYPQKGAKDFLNLIGKGREVKNEYRISDIMNWVLDTSLLKKNLREDQDEERLENIDELIQSVKRYEKTHAEEEPTLENYLQDIALYTNTDHKKDNTNLKLMTIHQAKGLEFPFVFVIGLSEGIFPNLKSVRERKKNGEEEERRLMYVAVTRAEKALFLTESEGFNISTKMNKYPSRFLAEIKREMVVTEGEIPEELWEGTRMMRHVLDQESYVPDVPGAAALSSVVGGDPFASEREAYNSPFKIGDKVVHDIFGEGTVIGMSDDFSTFEVQFPEGGTRNIRAGFLHLSLSL